MHNHCTLWLGVGVAFYSSLKHSHMFRISLSLTKHFSLLFSGDEFDNDLNRIGTNTNKCTHTELLRNEYGPVVYAKWKQCNQTNNKKAVKSTFQCVYEYVCAVCIYTIHSDTFGCSTNGNGGNCGTPVVVFLSLHFQWSHSNTQNFTRMRLPLFFPIRLVSISIPC